MERPSWAPGEIDLERPSIARVYDYYLGGSHNFPADREFARESAKVVPELPVVARASRWFLDRAVRFLVEVGVRQFLDLGSGIPTVGNVHEVAQAAAPESRAVYVDVDPVAVAHSQAILARNERAVIIQADLREPERILDDPEVRRLLDLDEPVGVLMVAVLHFFPDSQAPASVVAGYRDAIVPGSHLVISHASYGTEPDQAERAAAMYRRGASSVTLRSRREIAALFGGFELIDPGIVAPPLWRPGSPGEVGDGVARFPGLVGVGRKPR
ncbi:MAG: SAM-dependent methyltransferase [Streptosporangiaceae bacterium]